MKKKKYWQKATEKMKICPMSEKTGENAKRPDRKGGRRCYTFYNRVY